MKNLKPLGIVGLLVLAGCGPSINPSLTPVKPVARWIHGAGFVEETRDGLTMSAAFQQASANQLVFLVGLANDGDTPVIVSPEKLQCVLSDPRDPMRMAAPSAANAQDPEAKLRDLENAKIMERSNQSTGADIVALFLVLEVADAVSIPKHRTKEENRREAERDRQLYSSMNQNKRHSEEREDRYSAQQKEIESTMLRKHTLEPGKRLLGRVEFNLNTTNFKKVTLKVPVESQVFEFEFRPKM
jgi:hypothetical protein